MSFCETVKIKFDNEEGYALLNADAFDETKHELFTEEAPKTENATSLTTGDGKTDETATAVKIQDAGAAVATPAWKAKKSKS